MELRGVCGQFVLVSGARNPVPVGGCRIHAVHRLRRASVGWFRLHHPDDVDVADPDG